MAKEEKPHVPAIDENWLAKRAETPHQPAIEIVDSHFHMWDFCEPAYMGDSYVKDAEANGIVSSVFVECTMGYRPDGPEELRVLGEVEFACQQARKYATPKLNLCAAIVAMADFTLGDAVEGVLDQLQDCSDGRLRGIRTRAVYDPDPTVGYGDTGTPPGILACPDYQSGLRKLQAANLSLDLYAFHTQLSEVEQLAKTFPDLPIILNHIGGPLGIGRYTTEREAVFHDWMNSMANLAAFENVFVKIGGFAISRLDILKTGGDMPPSSNEVKGVIRPWFEFCIEKFGVDRCLFGSNFPVDKAGSSMTVLLNAMKSLTSELSEDERRAFFSQTAKRLYRI